jgi:Sir2 family
MRRRVAAVAKPNPAHVALAKLEQKLRDRLFLCTQNVDDLHEQAGSKHVVHMHGELFKSRCDTCSLPTFSDTNTYDPPAELPRCVCGGGIRPHICWFGEVLSNWIASSAHSTNARSSWLWSHRESWSQRRALSPTLAVERERSTWGQRNLPTHPRSRIAIWETPERCCLICLARLAHDRHCSLTYSALACFRMGMSGSASFQS